MVCLEFIDRAFVRVSDESSVKTLEASMLEVFRLLCRGWQNVTKYTRQVSECQIVDVAKNEGKQANRKALTDER